MGVIDLVNFKYGMIGIEGHAGISVDLVVSVKRSGLIEELTSFAEEVLGFSHFFR